MPHFYQIAVRAGKIWRAPDQPSPLFRSLCFKVSVIHLLHDALEADLGHSNMLNISFGMRTGSCDDPLVEKALELTMEFMDLTGQYLARMVRLFCG